MSWGNRNYSAVSWQFFNPRTEQWVEFPRKTVVTIEKHHDNVSGGKPCLIEHGDGEYKVEFEENRAVDTRNWHRWLRIRRIDGREQSSPQATIQAARGASATAGRPSPQHQQQQHLPPPVQHIAHQDDRHSEYDDEEEEWEEPEVHHQRSPQREAWADTRQADEFVSRDILPPGSEAHCRLYLNRVSTNCIGPWILLTEGNVLYDLVDIDLMKGEQLKADFTQLNPRHQVPTLLDEDGTVVWESNAIMRYICNTYTLEDHWYPLDTKARARTEMALDWRQTRFYVNVSTVAYPSLGFQDATAGINAAKQALKEDFDLLEGYFLAESRFISGDKPSIADLAVALPLIYLEATNVQVPAGIRAYKQRVGQALGPSWENCTRSLKEYIASL